MKVTGDQKNISAVPSLSGILDQEKKVEGRCANFIRTVCSKGCNPLSSKQILTERGETARQLLLDYLRQSEPDLKIEEIQFTGEKQREYCDSSLDWQEDRSAFAVITEGTEIHFKCKGQSYTFDTDGQKFILRGIALFHSKEDPPILAQIVPSTKNKTSRSAIKWIFAISLIVAAALTGRAFLHAGNPFENELVIEPFVPRSAFDLPKLKPEVYEKFPVHLRIRNEQGEDLSLEGLNPKCFDSPEAIKAGAPIKILNDLAARECKKGNGREFHFGEGFAMHVDINHEYEGISPSGKKVHGSSSSSGSYFAMICETALKNTCSFKEKNTPALELPAPVV